MNPDSVTSSDDFLQAAAAELIEAAREFLRAELPQVPVSDALLLCFFTQKRMLITTVLEQMNMRRMLADTTIAHIRRDSTTKILSGTIATIVLAHRGIICSDSYLSGVVQDAMKRVAGSPH